MCTTKPSPSSSSRHCRKAAVRTRACVDGSVVWQSRRDEPSAWLYGHATRSRQSADDDDDDTGRVTPRTQQQLQQSESCLRVGRTTRLPRSPLALACRVQRCADVRASAQALRQTAPFRPTYDGARYGSISSLMPASDGPCANCAVSCRDQHHTCVVDD